MHGVATVKWEYDLFNRFGFYAHIVGAMKIVQMQHFHTP